MCGAEEATTRESEQDGESEALCAECWYIHDHRADYLYCAAQWAFYNRPDEKTPASLLSSGVDGGPQGTTPQSAASASYPVKPLCTRMNCQDPECRRQHLEDSNG